MSLVSTLRRRRANAGWRRRVCFLRMANFNKLTQTALQVRRKKRHNRNNRTMGIQADVSEVARQPLKFTRYQAWVVRHWQTSATVSTGASALPDRFWLFIILILPSTSSLHAVEPYLVLFSSFNITILFSLYAGREDWGCLGFFCAFASIFNVAALFILGHTVGLRCC